MRMPVCRLSLFLLGMFFATALAAQEDCANGLDDDGDGLIDLNDTADCDCGQASSIPSLLPNPSLEVFDAGQEGCESIQPGGLPDAPNQANCLVGWQRASLGTTDAWNAFTLSGAPPFFPASLPQPLPSGTGIAGFWVGVRDDEETIFYNGDGSTTLKYREYLAACLEGDNRLEAGQDYRLAFSLGFMPPTTFQNDQGSTVEVGSPSPVELNVYGIRSCDQVYFGDYYNCPEEAGAAGYERIATVRVTGTEGTWSPVTLDFTAANDYAAFAIGGSCGNDVGRDNSDYYRNYYFIDDVILNRPEVFNQAVAGPVSVSGQTICADEITLTGQQQTGADYQWYKDGAALVGETGVVLTLTPDQDIDGAYALRISTATGCAVTDDVVIQRPILPDQVPDSVALCPGTDTILLRPLQTTGATFTWSDGSTLPYFFVTEPGTYSVTVSTVCEQQIEEFAAAEVDNITAALVVDPPTFCEGEMVDVSISSNYYYDAVVYATLDGSPIFINATGDAEFEAGAYDTLLVQIYHGCGQLTDTLVITPDETFDVSADITDLSCESPVGSIALTLTDPDQVEYLWTDSLGNSLPSTGPRLETTAAGTYTVELADGVRCPATFTYELIYADSLNANLTVDSVSCGSDGAARANPGGGTAPYTLAWFRGEETVPFASDTAAVGGLESGLYRVETRDATGCSRSQVFEVGAPDTLSFVATTTFADCERDGSGVITVTPTGGVPPYVYSLDGGSPQPANVFSELAAGTYAVAVQDSRGCASITETVTVAEPTPFSLSLPEEIALFLGDSTLLELSVTGVPAESGQAVWSPTDGLSYPFGEGSTTVSARPGQTTRYEVTFTSAEGCSQTADVLVVVEETARLYVPSAFSPNNDQTNDVLLVYPGPSIQEVLSFRVHNRWGGLVYEWDGQPGSGWDGTVDNQPLDPDVFFYLVDTRLVNGRTFSFAGSVTLLR